MTTAATDTDDDDVGASCNLTPSVPVVAGDDRLELRAGVSLIPLTLLF